MIARPDLGRWLVVMFALMPPIGVNAALGVAPLLAVAAVGVVVLRPSDAWRWLVAWQWLAAALAALAVLGTASALWSILPGHSLIEGLRLLTLSASGLVVAGAVTSLGDDARDRLVRWTAVSIVVTVAVLAIDLTLGLRGLRFVIDAAPDTQIRLERFDRGTTVIGLLFWPIAFGLWRGRRYGLLAATTIAAVAALIIIPSSANRLAVGVGAVTWLAVCAAPRVVPRAILVATIVLGLCLPIALPQLLPSNESIVSLSERAPWIKFSGLHRLLIWRFVSERVAERPLLGWGIDASRELPGGHTKLADTVSQPVVPDNAEALPLHPHNAFLQWWVELGAVGAILGLGIVATLLWRAGALRPRDATATAMAYAAAALTIAMLGYGVWQSWWLSTLWLAGALVAAVTSSNSPERQTRKS